MLSSHSVHASMYDKKRWSRLSLSPLLTGYDETDQFGWGGLCWDF